MRSHGVSDETLVRSLGVYVGMVDRVLSEPERWLGVAEDEAAEPTDPGHRALQTLRSRTLGAVSPGEPDWKAQPLHQREEWWVDRIALAAGLAAAAPHVAGALADRLPLQDALGASAAGLAVCAVARERAVTEPADWVPLLAKVLFDRDVTLPPTPVPTGADPEGALLHTDEAGTDGAGAESSVAGSIGLGVQRSARTLWRLAATLRDLQHLLDERPRGGLLARTVAKVPVVGVAGGWFDERGAIRKAASEAAQLLG
jgi:hypothetical protein